MNSDQDRIDAFVAAAHGDLERVRELLEAHPELRDARHSKTAEDALGAAAHVGNRAIVAYLLAQGAAATIFSAATLGDIDAVRAFLDRDPALANGRGAHGIPVLVHASISGNTELAELLYQRGCRHGFTQALHGAAVCGHADMTRWLLDKGVDDIDATSSQGLSALDLARRQGHAEVVRLLEERGAGR